MVRPLRIEFPGAVYHVTSRGDRREPIAVDDFDRAQFLNILSQGFERFEAKAFAYCLMGNHYHLVTAQSNLSRLMRHINGVYTQAFNRRHRLSGHLFQGRFKAILVDTDSYLLEVCRYVDLNPVRAAMVTHPSEYPWSSYRALANISPAATWHDRSTVYEQLSPNQTTEQAGRDYAEFVAQGRGVRLWDEALKQQIYLGDDTFIHKMQAHADIQVRGAGDAGNQRLANLSKVQSTAPPLDWPIERYVDQANGAENNPLSATAQKARRNQAMQNAFFKGGYTQTAIATAFGVSGSTVSRIVQALDARKGEMT
jgi:putative transposase